MGGENSPISPPLDPRLQVLAYVAGGIRERASGGGAAISSHGFATRVHGFATKTKALAREIPPATQANQVLYHRFLF